jgi:hypothetical protein
MRRHPRRCRLTEVRAVNAANEPFAIVVDLNKRFAALFAAVWFFGPGWHDCCTTRDQAEGYEMESTATRGLERTNHVASEPASLITGL